MRDRDGSSLLIEIGTEELPPRALRALGECFASNCVDALKKALLCGGEVRYRWFATPRRIAVLVRGVWTRQPDQTNERRGPNLKAAFDERGAPTQAALGFAASCGVDVAGLDRLTTDKGEWLVYRQKQKGQTAKALVPGCIEAAVKRLPIPKRMRWGEGDAEFVRPVHWLVVLHGNKPIKTKLLSVTAAPKTRGHRFHCPEPLPIPHADDYEDVLAGACVIADFEQRKHKIHQQINALVRRNKGTVTADDDLLEQVTGLVEWPHALLGRFDQRFLELPAEVLVSSMRDHQKYFHVSSADGGLLPCFVTISNIKSSSPARIRSGNERVLRARLSDAEFFWNTDRKKSLEQHGTGLADVTFHNRLGSVADKTQRMQHLARVVAPLCQVDVEHCVRAATLAKADLVTDMVGEFPDLQGVMGFYYAQNDGEDDAVARACVDHYKPRFAGDELPGDDVSSVIALVDRLDSLVGIFAAGEEPSGDKDPYGLRRASLGVLRLLIEGGLDLDLEQLLQAAADAYRQTTGTGTDMEPETIARVFRFIMDRLQAYYQDRGFAVDEITAVMASNPTNPTDFDHRLRAVSDFRRLDAAVNLAAANKRISNILKKADITVPDDFDPSLVGEDAEQELAQQLRAMESSVLASFSRAQYGAGLDQLASLKEPVDRFFDEVMVMVEDDALRRNRLSLLYKLQNLFLQVADISYLQDPG